ncbi:MAG: Electron transfer flavoprotein subunit alpha [Gammaproteobacteria bacterium]|nr:Electron transfer flavoprotein subunit alpha [Gammaproteobacteria bacterium]
MAVLVVSEHNNSELLEVALHAVTAASRMGGPVEMLVAGSGCAGVADTCARVGGVERVLLADAPEYEHHMPENIAPLIVGLAEGYSHVVAAATTYGKNVMPRVSALLDVAQISDISAVFSEDTFERPIYAGNALAKVQSADPIKVVTVRTTKFDAAGIEGGNAEVENVEAAVSGEGSRFVEQNLSQSNRPELTSARTVVSGGRGVGSAENFRMIEDLAASLNAAVGASRAAVDAGYVPNDYQVGQTGKVVAPDLYLAIGISGAIQHLAGMKDSKVIAAINNDEEAPIFQVADYGLVEDLFTAVPALTEALKA